MRSDNLSLNLTFHSYLWAVALRPEESDPSDLRTNELDMAHA
jgi:hypothetical protein